MGSPKEHDRLFPNLWNNKEPQVASSGTEVTFTFNETGTDTDSAYYYGFNSRKGAYHICIRPSATVLIKKINGSTMSDPITVSTVGFTDTHGDYSSMVIETTADNTVIKVLAKGN